jgi:fumarate reductase subunit D
MGGSSLFWLAFGRGGVERFVAYPVLLWIIGFGGYLMGASENRQT